MVILVSPYCVNHFYDEREERMYLLPGVRSERRETRLGTVPSLSSLSRVSLSSPSDTAALYRESFIRDKPLIIKYLLVFANIHPTLLFQLSEYFSFCYFYSDRFPISNI